MRDPTLREVVHPLQAAIVRVCNPAKGGADPVASLNKHPAVPSRSDRKPVACGLDVGSERAQPCELEVVSDAVPSRSACEPAGHELELGADFIEAQEARHTIATLTIIRVCRARVALRALHALTRWRAQARAIAMDELIGEQLAPLLASRVQMLSQLHLDPEEYVAFGDLDPEEYVAFGDEPVEQSPRHATAGETSLEIALLRDELRAAESGLNGRANNFECPSSPAERADVRGRLEFSGAIGGLSVGTPSLLSVSPAMDEHETGQRSPTSSDASATPTSCISRSSSGRTTGGLTLKQLSEGDRALKAAFEREMRRAADLAKVKLKLERTDKRLERAQQALRDSLAETERLRAELVTTTAAGRLPPHG